MNLIIQTVFNVPNEENPQEMLHRIGDYLNQLINEGDGLGEEIRLYGMELKAAVDDNAGKKVFLHDAEKIEPELGEMFQHSDKEKEIHIIRISIEGAESHRRRFELMDEVIERMGRSPNEEQLNIYFIFDTGQIESFSQWAIPLIVSPNPILIHKAKSEKVTFCQWISRKDREQILMDVEKNKNTNSTVIEEPKKEEIPAKKELDEVEKWFKEQF